MNGSKEQPASRRVKLADELRANLKRRKAKTRGVGGAHSDASEKNEEPKAR